MSDSENGSVHSGEEEKVIEDLSNSDVVSKYRIAAEIANSEWQKSPLSALIPWNLHHFPTTTAAAAAAPCRCCVFLCSQRPLPM